MFVRDGDTYHVLMPQTGIVVGGTHVPQHKFTLDYDGGTKGRPMSGWFVDLTPAEGNGDPVDLKNRPEIIDPGALAGKKVDKAQWGKCARNSVIGRVTLPGRGEIVTGSTAEYLVTLKDPDCTVYGEKVRHLTHRITWKLRDVEADFFAGWKRQRLRPDERCETEVLERLEKPVPGAGDVVHLKFHHAIPGARCLEKYEEAMHFQAYHNVFKNFPQVKAHPSLNQDPPSSCAERAGSPFNCMLAQSPPG
jgi:hypothetical protein